MIKVKKDFDAIPRSLDYSRHETRMENVLDKKNLYSFEGYNEQDVKNELYGIYHYKCAYCESKEINATFQVEHYRPKKEVTENTAHEGYYWLAYEWSNLLLSCPHCNSQGKKGNHFPIADESKRVKTHPADKKDWRSNSSTMQNEEPLLLNPELDDPDEHLSFSYDGTIQPKTERGKETIENCKLNREHHLLPVRKEIVDNFFADIKTKVRDFLEYLENKLPVEKEKLIRLYKTVFQTEFERIIKRKEPTGEFSKMYCLLYDEFYTCLDNVLVVKDVPPEHKKLICDAFSWYVESKNTPV